MLHNIRASISTGVLLAGKNSTDDRKIRINNNKNTPPHTNKNKIKYTNKEKK